MDPVPRIHDVVHQAEFAGNVELIDVPFKGDPVTLLRSKRMPEFAFVMWVSESTGTFSKIAFRLPDHKVSDAYLVVCACCPSEVRGLTPPSQEGLELVSWKEQRLVEFKDMLVETCRSSGITTLFMRRADSWLLRYGRVEGLEVVEAQSHYDAYLELYGRRIVQQELQFIDHDASQGLRE